MPFNEDLRQRLIAPVVALIGVLLLGTIGYQHLGGGRWGFADCLYMTVITLTTVGYGEVLEGMENVRYVREFTTVLIITGMGVFVYFASHVTATIIEGDLQRALRKTRMRKKISRLEGHVVVCGTGSTGRHVVDELITANRSCVAVDIDQPRLERYAAQWGDRRFFYVAGDATEDSVLDAANVATAGGVVAALPNDKDNLYLVVTARQVNPTARIVARGSDLGVLEKLRKAGADTVVSPNFIGGMRMVSELLRPHVVRFLDEMLRDRKGNWRVEEIAVPAGSGFAGTTLAEVDLRRRFDVGVLAARDDEGRYRYNPGADFTIDPPVTLVVLGRIDRVNALRDKVGA